MAYLLKKRADSFMGVLDSTVLVEELLDPRPPHGQNEYRGGKP